MTNTRKGAGEEPQPLHAGDRLPPHGPIATATDMEDDFGPLVEELNALSIIATAHLAEKLRKRWGLG